MLTVAYDGQPFAGFVPQRDQRTVASELLAAIRELDPSVDALRVASRTDAGVHARAQLVAFDTCREIPARGWALGINRYLPDSIAVRAAAPVAVGFSPRHEAAIKRYRYLVLSDWVRDPLWAGRAWRVMDLADEGVTDTLVRELSVALGEHDFASFQSARDVREHTVRTLTAVQVEQLQAEPPLIAIDITGDGFLYNMVRILVGTTVDVARGRLEPGAMQRALAAKDRRSAGITAPAHGLYLQEITLRSSCPDSLEAGAVDRALVRE